MHTDLKESTLHAEPLAANTTAAVFKSIASDLDDGNLKAALEALRRLDAPQCDPTFRDVRRALWSQALQRALQTLEMSGQTTSAALAALSSSEDLMIARPAAISAHIKRSLGAARNVWAGAITVQELHPVFGQLPACERLSMLVFVLENKMLNWSKTFWDTCLKDPDFRPTLDMTLRYFSCFEEEAERALVHLKAQCDALKRPDLMALFEVYEAHIFTSDAGAMFERAGALVSQSDRCFVLEQMTWMRLSPNALPAAITFAEGEGEAGLNAMRYCQMWQAADQHEWEIVAALANRPAQGGAVAELQAYAGAAAFAVGDADHGRRLCRRLRENHSTPWYMRDFAAQITGLGRIKEREERLAFGDRLAPVQVGRPVVQMLWVGKRLAATALISIHSFLRNGWRVQLYAYEMPENVPDGVEVMDGASVLPVKNLFREDARSGPHEGSLGAFSDLFRYALLAMKGGLWADTDTINLTPFEPVDRQLIATEAYAPGILGLNGSLLASRPDDGFMNLALERAESLSKKHSMHFARIGPTLLADLATDFGMQGYTILQPSVQNPIPCTEVGAFFGAPEAFLARISGVGAVNLHMFTETWRVQSRSLEKLSDPKTAVGLLYQGLVHENPQGTAFLDRLVEATQRNAA